MYQPYFNSEDLANYILKERHAGNLTLPSEALWLMVEEFREAELRNEQIISNLDNVFRSILSEIFDDDKMNLAISKLTNTDKMLKADLISTMHRVSTFLECLNGKVQEAIDCPAVNERIITG